MRIIAPLLLGIALLLPTSTFATRILAATERYELSSFEYLAFGTTSCGEPFATVLDPEGFAHRVAVHDHIGTENGRIVAIDEDKISLVELRQDSHGAWQEVPAELQRGRR